MLADMFRSHGVDAAVIGGTRGVGSVDAAVTIDDVQIDPQHSATYCFQPATSIWIGHPSDDEQAVALRRKGNSRTIEWPAGTNRIEWPGDVPIDDGSQFDIASGSTVRATVTFRVMPADARSLAATVADGIILGCHDQFDPELRRVSRAVERPELWMTTDHGRRPTYRDTIMSTTLAPCWYCSGLIRQFGIPVVVVRRGRGLLLLRVLSGPSRWPQRNLKRNR